MAVLAAAALLASLSRASPRSRRCGVPSLAGLGRRLRTCSEHVTSGPRDASGQAGRLGFTTHAHAWSRVSVRMFNTLTYGNVPSRLSTLTCTVAHLSVGLSRQPCNDR